MIKDVYAFREQKDSCSVIHHQLTDLQYPPLFRHRWTNKMLFEFRIQSFFTIPHNANFLGVLEMCGSGLCWWCFEETCFIHIQCRRVREGHGHRPLRYGPEKSSFCPYYGSDSLLVRMYPEISLSFLTCTLKIWAAVSYEISAKEPDLIWCKLHTKSRIKIKYLTYS
jgi:hypothetical protein